MKELFKQLVSSTHKNELSAKNALKLWILIISGYWSFHFALQLFLPILLSFSHLLNILSVFINQLSLMVLFLLIGNKANLLTKFMPSVQIQFISAPHIFIFSYFVIQLILCSVAVGSEVGYVLMHILRFTSVNKISLIFNFINFSPVAATLFIYISYFLFSLLGFFVFHKILQYGWFGVRIQGKND